MPESRVSPTLIGALIAVVLVGALGGAIYLKSRPRAAEAPLPADKPVMVAVVLPDLSGTLTPRAITLYSMTGGKLTSVTVDPDASMTVPGTSAGELSGAYLFGGGDLLARTYAASAGIADPAWVVVTGDSLAQLDGGRGMDLNLPAPVDVFDGTTLSSFPTGTVIVAASDLPKLMDGVEYLGAGDRQVVRTQLGVVALDALARSSAPLKAGVKTSMQPLQLEAWLEALGVASKVSP